METEISSATNQTGSATEPVEMDEIRTGFYVEIPNPIVFEPPVQAMATQNQVLSVRDSHPIIQPARQTEMADESDDDLIILTPATVDIKREQQELSLELAKKCKPNVMIDIMDDEDTIVMKTEVNDENLAPNRFNAMEYPIKRNVMAKKPQKPIVERCVGRICAPKKRFRLNDLTMDYGATDGPNESENEMISESEDEMVSQTEGKRANTEPGIIDATDVNLVAIAFQEPIADLVSAYRQPAVTSIPIKPCCQLCNSVHVSMRALRSHYKTKKHTSKVLELARAAARKFSSDSKASNNQNNFESFFSIFIHFRWRWIYITSVRYPRWTTTRCWG